MKKIFWIIAGVLLVSVANADNFECRPLGKKKIFMRCGKSIIQSDVPLTIMKLLSASYPVSKILSDDLDNDGINDFVVYATEGVNDQLNDRVIVLKGKSDGSFELIAKSKMIEYGKADIEIKNHSLFITRLNNTLNDSDSETYQFKSRANGFILVGAELFVSHPENRDNFRTSINYLTGAKIISKTENGVSNEIKSKLLDHEPELQFSKPIRLEEFER